MQQDTQPGTYTQSSTHQDYNQLGADTQHQDWAAGQQEEEEDDDGDDLDDYSIQRRGAEEKASTCGKKSCCAMHGWLLASIRSIERSNFWANIHTWFRISRPTLTRSSAAVNRNPSTIDGISSKGTRLSIAAT